MDMVHIPDAATVYGGTRNATARPKGRYPTAMILTCPSCETRYQVDEAAIDRAAGRQVRCANCGYLWHFAPSLEEHSPAQSAPAAGPALGRATAAGVLETNAASAVSTP